MTQEAKQILGAIALLVFGFYLGRNQASAVTDAAAHNNVAGAPEQWWTFAGSWAS